MNISINHSIFNSNHGTNSSLYPLIGNETILNSTVIGNYFHV
jgi:hypothetical protein